MLKHLAIILLLFTIPVPAQVNLSLSNDVQAPCASAPVVYLQFQQPVPANVYLLQFDIRYQVSQFQSLFSDDGNPANDSPIIRKSAGALPDHSIDAYRIEENDPEADGDPETAQWRVLIIDYYSPFTLVPNGRLIELQFSPASTATNGAHPIRILAISGSDMNGVGIWTLTGADGQITLSDCSTSHRQFLPLILKP